MRGLMKTRVAICAPLAVLLLSFAVITGVWWWLATPIVLARAPIDPAAKLLCVSYAPFRDAQTPLLETTRIVPEQIAADLAQREPPHGVSAADLESFGRNLFQSLWRLDFIAIKLAAT